MTVGSVNHITITVRDMNRTARLFIDALGAIEVYRSSQREYSIFPEIFLRLGDLWLVVMQDETVEHQRSYDHIAISVSPQYIHEFRARLADAGAEMAPARQRVHQEAESIYFYDFDNHLFELHTGSIEQRLDHYIAARAKQMGRE